MDLAALVDGTTVQWTPKYRKKLLRVCAVWLPEKKLREQYDLALSYAWHKHETQLTDGLYDHFRATDEEEDEEETRVTVFVDRQVVHVREPVRVASLEALSRTLVAVVIVSAETLRGLVRLRTDSGPVLWDKSSRRQCRSAESNRETASVQPGYDLEASAQTTGCRYFRIIRD